MSGIYEKINSLPKKGQTCMSKEFDENGVPFSGGEQQKVAISRAFYEDSNVIIMDEPSSALDPIAEYEMNLSIKELMKLSGKYAEMFTKQASSYQEEA